MLLIKQMRKILIKKQRKIEINHLSTFYSKQWLKKQKTEYINNLYKKCKIKDDFYLSYKMHPNGKWTIKKICKIDYQNI
jgi:hypothetical protein